MCKDTIYRQAAIDAVTGWLNIARHPTNRSTYNEGEIDAYKTALSELIKIPSAQPDWIPCSETVDIPDHEVLACDERGEEMLGYLECTAGQWVCASEDGIMYEPIAWMEKPEPYAERRQ